MTKYAGLGRGLSALIPTKDEKLSTSVKDKKEVFELPLEIIKANPRQPRSRMNRHDLEDLVNSIKVHGIIQPILVSPLKDGYQLIAGERRFQAAKILNLKTIPAIVRLSAENEQLELALIENLQREDLNPLDRASAYHQLMTEFNLTQEEVAKKLGQSRSQISNSLRLLQLPDEIKKAIIEDKISEGHAKALLGLKTVEEQLLQLKKILSGSLTVREAEEQIRRVNVKSHRRRLTTNPNLVGNEEILSEKFGTKVKITKRGGRGRISIEFYSEEEYNSLLNKLIQ